MIKYYNGEMYVIPKEFEEETRADERKKVLEEVEKLYRDWLYSEYGKKADTDNLTIRVINHLKEQNGETE